VLFECQLVLKPSGRILAAVNIRFPNVVFFRYRRELNTASLDDNPLNGGKAITVLTQRFPPTLKMALKTHSYSHQKY